MRFASSPTWRWMALIGLIYATTQSSLAGPPKHGHHHARVASAKEAGMASVKKVQLRKKLHGLHANIHHVRAKIHEAKAKENRISETIGTVESRIQRTKHRLAQVHVRLSALNARHEQVVENLDATQRRLVLRRRLLAQRVAENYERGQATYTGVLLRSRSVHELLSRGYYVRKIVESDTELIQGVKQDIRLINADKQELEKQAREAAALAAEVEAEKARYAADLKEKQELLHQVRETRVEEEQELDGLEADSNAITGEIRSLSEMLRRRRDAQIQEALALRRRHMRRQDPQEGGGQSPERVAPVWHGGFERPCDGPRTSGFGYRYHPILHYRRMHTGVDFGAHYGASIRAAAGGTVIVAQYYHGYGNCVIIDHGNGVTTLYGHASALLVSEGDSVSQGQVIARVGATGLATGPHLHFEVRHNGVPVEPPF